MSLVEKTLVACATRRSELAERVHHVTQLLGQEFILGGEVDQTILQCERRPSSCFVVDYRLAAGAYEIVSRCSAPVLVVVPPGNLKAAFMAGQVGALDIINDDDPDDEVATCLQAAIETAANARITESFSDPVYQSVTAREKDILRCLMAGEQNKRVASILDVGLRTVEAGRANLMTKLHVHSFAELIIFVSRIENQKSAGFRQAYESIRNKTAETRQ